MSARLPARQRTRTSGTTGRSGTRNRAGMSESGREATGPGGLAVAADGYALRPVSGAPTAGQPGEFAFEIAQWPAEAGDGVPDQPRAAVAPDRGAAGPDRVPAPAPADGRRRHVARAADPAGGGDVAGLRRLPPGRSRPAGHPRRGRARSPARTSHRRCRSRPRRTTVDGYTVDVDGHLTAGQTSRLTMAVARGGAPVTDLQPYLGAYGHLVVLRAGDLAYLHVHPERSDTAGPEIAFDVEVPTAGRVPHVPGLPARWCGAHRVGHRRRLHTPGGL